MSYFAAAVVRGPKGWAASDFNLSGVSDVEDVADRLRDFDLEATLSLLFVEIDEEYLVLLRLDDGEDLRVFGSDSVLMGESRLGAVLVADLEPPDHGIDIPDDLEDAEAADDTGDPDTGDPGTGEPATPPDTAADPVGDVDILADLGIGSGKLLAMCAQEGKLPSDVTADVCELLGCGGEVEELREA
ncbi:MAG: tRNA adenosine deaminase-associated protein [Micromonosporaceae bacterium]